MPKPPTSTLRAYIPEYHAERWSLHRVPATQPHRSKHGNPSIRIPRSSLRRIVKQRHLARSGLKVSRKTCQRVVTEPWLGKCDGLLTMAEDTALDIIPVKILDIPGSAASIASDANVVVDPDLPVVVLEERRTARALKDDKVCRTTSSVSRVVPSTKPRPRSVTHHVHRCGIRESRRRNRRSVFRRVEK